MIIPDRAIVYRFIGAKLLYTGEDYDLTLPGNANYLNHPMFQGEEAADLALPHVYTLPRDAITIIMKFNVGMYRPLLPGAVDQQYQYCLQREFNLSQIETFATQRGFNPTENSYGGGVFRMHYRVVYGEHDEDEDYQPEDTLSLFKVREIPTVFPSFVAHGYSIFVTVPGPEVLPEPPVEEPVEEPPAEEPVEEPPPSQAT